MAKYIKDLISVIVPVYNTEKYVERCLDSIIMQTYKNLEIIIIDDGSTDDSYRVCREFMKKDDRIILLHQENSGVVSARNNGIDHAKGEFIVFVDSDDYVEKTMYEKMINQRRNCDLVSCAVIRHISEDEKNDEVIYRKDCFNDVIACDEKFYNKMIYDFENEVIFPVLPNIYNKLFYHNKIDQFYKQLNNEIYNGEDLLFVCNYILLCNSICFLDTPLYNYCFREDSCVHSVRENELSNFNELYIELKKIFKNHYMAESLIKQSQKYTQIFVIRSLNSFMGFDKSIRVPRYIPDVEELRGKKIAVYGAGITGQDVICLLNKLNYNITLWVDKNYAYYRELGFDVCDVEKLFEIQYDVVLIAVERENVILDIKNKLISLGIKEEKIISKKLKCLF